MGLGGIPGTHPLSLGMLGMHGTYQANMAVHHSDVLIAIGARFDDRVTGKVEAFCPEAKVIHIDIDPTSIRKNVNVHIPIVGDVKAVLQELIPMLREEMEKTWEMPREAWLRQIRAWAMEHPLQYEMDENVIKPQYVIEKIYELTGGDAIVTTEVGQCQMWTAQFFKFEQPRTFLNSGGLGTMGYGFPAAIGAQMAFPDRTVIDIAGDGSLEMNIQELAVAVHHRLPVKVAILNNRSLGMVRQWQKLFFNERYSASDLEGSPDFVKLAEAYGAVGLRAEKPGDVEPVIREALGIRRPVLMDFVVDRDECVYPMVPAGAANVQMIFGPEKKAEKRLRVVRA